MRHDHSLAPWQHSHDFAADHSNAERGTTRVMWLAAAMMVVEVAAGMFYGSMALLADGWHMATHVAAFGIAVFAYRYARRHADNPRFTLGTGKVGVLGGFASAVALLVVAAMLGIESAGRIIEPRPIAFTESLIVAALGLVVNLVSGLMLQGHHDHGHVQEGGRGHGHEHGFGHGLGHAEDHVHGHDDGHDHGHGHGDDHDHDHAHGPASPSGHGHATDQAATRRTGIAQSHDHNLRAAYLHVLADALTSLLAIVALLAGRFFGWLWLDTAIGILGAIVIARWAWALLRETSDILLDASADEDTRDKIRERIESGSDARVADLHVWYLGPQRLSAAVSVVTHDGHGPEHYKGLLRDLPHLAHVMVEVNVCDGEVCGDEAVIMERAR